MNKQVTGTLPSLPIIAAAPRRYFELDSIRGIAALVVVLQHFGLALPENESNIFFHLQRGGHRAVIVFFLLSGFVLTLPLRTGRRQRYPTFVVRRICRIYLPYVAALILAIAADWVVGQRPIGNQWVDQSWSHPITGALVGAHLVFLGQYDWSQLNTAFWSLIYEMRISLVFPFIALGIMVLPGWIGAAAALLCSLLSVTVAVLLAELFGLQAADSLAWAITLHYLALFMVGSLLVKYLPHLEKFFALRSKKIRIGCIVAALLLIVALPAHKLAVVAGYWPRMLFADQLADWITVLTAAVLLIGSLQSRSLQHLLHWTPVRRLGERSYSLYLVHGTVLFILVKLLGAGHSIYFVLAPYIILSLLLAEGFFRLVEYPSMLLGRQLTRKRLVMAVCTRVR